MPYYGQITAAIYAKALVIRGDDELCWGEMVPLAEPALVFGSQFPEDMDGDSIIEIWEEALKESEQEFGSASFNLDSVTIYLEEMSNSIEGQYVWEKKVTVKD